MKPDAFFEFADWTLQNNPTAAGRRSVTSRAYYAAIHKAVEFLVVMGVRLPSDTNLHSRVPDIFAHANDKDVAEVGVMLRALRSQRNEADYDLAEESVETHGFAASRLRDASKIIGRLNTYALSKGQLGSKFESVRPSIVARAEFLAKGPR